MIEKIVIKDLATYSPTVAEEMASLKKINFVYGSNGTGKTTISRVIADDAAYKNCSLGWRGGLSIDTFVYNRDFVEQNFNQPEELKGIFTLGEKDKGILNKIDVANSELSQINEKVIQLEATLKGEGGNGGKAAELEKLEEEFESKCWDLKLKHEEKLKKAFAGFMGRKKDFKEKLLKESKSNTFTAIPLTDLERKAETIFADEKEMVSELSITNSADLLAHEVNSILRKKVIGKTDVDIAALIKKLGNSDWVKQGREFYDAEERLCPFCQQDTPTSLEESLNAYFDETFMADTAAIEKFQANYKTDSERVQQNIWALLDTPSRFLDSEKLQNESNLLNSKIRTNIQKIAKKRRELSKPVEFVALKGVLDKIKILIGKANTEIQEHNITVSNIKTERATLTGQIWRYLLDNEIKRDIETYIKNKTNIQKGIDDIETKIKHKTIEQQTKKKEIKNLEKDTTSIQPTIDSINDLLRAFGFTGFALAKSDRDRFYKIQRSDGSDAKESLSEGERSFLVFLYFYHLLKGSKTDNGMTSDRIVVFDDPVSSMDSDIFFIVSNLIKEVFDDVRNGSGTLKQVFVLTHNVYFHKEVSFHPKRDADNCLKDETFWSVRKSNHESKIRPHKTNPIKTSYDLLWREIRNPDRDNLVIQNAMRRILDNYYKILGNVNPDAICSNFVGKEKLICRSLFSWVNDGSHFAHDSLYISIDDSMVENYLRIFKLIFDVTGHIAHYDMMMGKNNTAVDAEGSETATPHP